MKNTWEKKIKYSKSLIGLLCLTGILFTQDPPENFNGDMVDHQSIQLNWDEPENNYAITAFISYIEDDGSGNLTLAVFMQNNSPVFGFNFTISSTIGNIEITDAYGGLADSIGMSVFPLGNNTVLGSGEYPIIPDADGDVLVYLSATYDIDDIGTISSLGQDIETVGFFSGGGLLLHQWHPIIWQVGIGMLSNLDCVCDDGQTYYTCPFDCNIPVTYNIFRDSFSIAENLESTSFLDEGLEPETDYCYTANAVNPFSTSVLTEEVCVQTDCITQPWFEDLDQDGLGNPIVFVISCGYETPENYVGNNLDEWPDCPNVEGIDPFDCNGNCFDNIGFNGEQMSEEEYLSEKEIFCNFNQTDSGCSYVDDCGECCDGMSGTECSYWLNENDFGGVYDCDEICYGEADIDGCGLCCSGLTGIECSYYVDQFNFGYAYDCAGECYGEALADACGICGGDGSTCVPPTIPDNILTEAIDESQIQISWDPSELPETNYTNQDVLAFVSEIETIDESVRVEIYMINSVPVAGFSITLVSSGNALIFNNAFGFGGTAEGAGMQVTVSDGGHILAAISPTDEDIPSGEGILTNFWASFDNGLAGLQDTLDQDTLVTAFSATDETVIPHNWMETIWEVGNGIVNIGFCDDGICSTDEAYLSDSEDVETCPEDCPPPITYDIQRFDEFGGDIVTIAELYEETTYIDTELEPVEMYCYRIRATAQYIEEPKISEYSDQSCTSTLCDIFIWYYDLDGDGLGDPDESIESCDSEPPMGYVDNGDDIYPYCFDNYYDCQNVCGGTSQNDIYGDCCDQIDIDLCGICFGDGLSCEGIEPPELIAIGSEEFITLLWTSVTGEIEEPLRMPLLSATVNDVQDNGMGDMIFEVSINNSGNDIAGFSISFDTGGMYVLDSIAPLGGLALDANMSLIVTSDNIFTMMSEEDILITESGVLLYVAGHYDVEDIDSAALINEGFPPTVFIDLFDNLISDEWIPTTWLLGSGLIEGGYCGDGFCEEEENFENCPEDCGGQITYNLYRGLGMMMSGMEDTSYVDSDGLLPDSVYCYTVTATNQVVTSLPSNEACASIDCELDTYYSDVDGDGLGDPDVSIQACGQPPGFVDNSNDLFPDCYENYYDCDETCGGLFVLDTNGECCDPDNLDTCGICYGENECEGYCGDGYCGDGENSENCPDDCEGYCGDGYCGDGENSENCPDDCEEYPGGPLNLIATGGDHQISLVWDDPDLIPPRTEGSLQIIINDLIDDGSGNVTMQVYMTNPEPISAFNFTLEPDDILNIVNVFGGSSSDADMTVNWLTPSTIIVMESDSDYDIPSGSEVLLYIEASYIPGMVGQETVITESTSPFNGFLNDEFEVVEYEWIPVTWSIGTGLINMPSYCGDNECGEDEDEDSCPYDCNLLSYIVYSDGIVIAIDLIESSYVHTGLGPSETHCYIVNSIIDGIVIAESNEACTTTDNNNIPVINYIQDQPGDDGGWVVLNIEPINLDTEPIGNFYEIFRVFQGDDWISVGTFGAYGWDEYFAVAPTIADSTFGQINLHGFKISYQGIESEIFYGYSVNNNPPDAPTGLMLSNIADEIYLNWNSNSEIDFQYYNVYSRTFGIEWGDIIDSTSVPSFIYGFPDQTMEYTVTAIDSSGNESNYSNIVSTSGGLLGDVNQDSAIDVLDIISVVYFILEMEIPTSYEFWAGDMNGDEMLDILDIIMIVNIILDDSLIRGDSVLNAEILLTDESISISSNGEIAGIQLEYTGNLISIESTLPDGWNIYYNENTILLFTTGGKPLMNQALFNYVGDLEIISNLITGFDVNPVTADVILVPDEFILHPNYPNPFNPLTTLRYTLPSKSAVQIAVFDILGREVAALVNEVQTPGEHLVQWDGDQFKSGVYFIRMETDSKILMQKILLLK